MAFSMNGVRSFTLQNQLFESHYHSLPSGKDPFRCPNEDFGGGGGSNFGNFTLKLEKLEHAVGSQFIVDPSCMG